MVQSVQALYTSLIKWYLMLMAITKFLFTDTLLLCAGAFRENGQAPPADDSALWGIGEEEGDGGGGLQDRP